MGFNPGSPGSHPGPKAGAKPLHHPGIPLNCILKLFFFKKTFFFFKDFIYLFMRDRDIDRGRSRLLTGSPMWDLILGPGTCPDQKADAQSLSHPGVPAFLCNP